MVDLMGMHLKEIRSKQQVTVLRRPEIYNPWPSTILTLLAEALTTLVHSRGLDNLRVLLLEGAFSREQIGPVLDKAGFSTFELEIIQGMDNPTLPFPIPIPIEL